MDCTARVDLVDRMGYDSLDVGINWGNWSDGGSGGG